MGSKQSTPADGQAMQVEADVPKPVEIIEKMSVESARIQQTYAMQSLTEKQL